MVHVHDLGSLWLESDGLPLPLSGNRLTSALSRLLLDRGEKVRTDVLIDAVWGESASSRAPAALDTLMWRLRRVLDPGRSANAASTILRTEEHGYRLTLPDDSVDSWNLDAAAHTIGTGRSAAATVEATAPVLALWRGRPYDDVADHGWLDSRRTQLADEHLLVSQARVDALLTLGEPERALAELISLIAGHPFAERLWASRMLGLYQSGRSSEALDAFTEIQSHLRDELGTTPGPDLLAMQSRVLRHDESLTTPERVPLARGAVRVPRHRTSLIGREHDLSAVGDLLHRRRLVSIVGPVGSGKTRLAAEFAHRARDTFPDGVFFVDLSDVADAPSVAERVLETVQLEEASSIDALAEHLATRSALLVLDNVEQLIDPVGALAAAVLDRDTTSRVLVTSRRVLGAEDEAVHALRALDLPSGTAASDLAASPAITLFVERAEAHGVRIDLGSADGIEVARICEAVDGLPLAIELAAARTPYFALHEVASSVAARPTALGTTGRPARDGEFTLGESIDSSYTLLSERERIAYRRLSVLPPRFTTEAAIAACTTDTLPFDQVTTVMIGLAGHSLLEATRPERDGGPSLFRQLVPIRAHAGERLRESGEASEVTGSLVSWIDSLVAGVRMGRADRGASDERVDDNRRTIAVALEAAIAVGPSDSDLVTLCRLVPYWWLGGGLSLETERLLEAAVASVTRANSAFAVAAATAAHAAFLTIARRDSSSSAALLEAIERMRRAPEGMAVFAGELLISIAAACSVGGDLVAANAAADVAAFLGEQLDDRDIRVLARAVRCTIVLVSDPAAAVTTAQEVLTESRAVGNSSAAIMCLHTLYMAALIAGDGPVGLRWSEEAIRVQQEIGQRDAATTLEARADLFVLAGRPLDAARCYGAASLQNERAGRSWPQLSGSDRLLETARTQADGDQFAAAWAVGARIAASDLIGAWT